MGSLRASTALISSILLMAAMCSSTTTPAGSPNILVIISDDQGFADVGYHGSDIRTPNIDALAASGLALDRFYTYPYCNPARSAFYSGMFPRRGTFNIPILNIDDGDGIEPGVYTIAERFHDAGYETALIGKWHMGTRPGMHPNANGFDYFYGFIGGVIHYFDHDWFNHSTQPVTRRLDWQRNGVEIEEPGYSTTLLGKDAAAFIAGRDSEKPFFLVLSFNAPHSPPDALPSVVASYEEDSDCSNQPRRCAYMAQVDTMDREIGRVLDALEEEQIAGETAVLFFSDNGGHLLYGASNAPFRGEKVETLEGALRVPAILKWTGVIKPGATDQRMRVEDIFATLEGVAKLERRAPAPSQNLWSGLLEGEIVAREPFYIANVPEHLAELNQACPSCIRVSKRRTALIADEWKLVTVQQLNVERSRYSRARSAFLYHLSVDPYEEKNVAESETDILRKMSEQLRVAEAAQRKRDQLPPSSEPVAR